MPKGDIPLANPKRRVEGVLELNELVKLRDQFGYEFKKICNDTDVCNFKNGSICIFIDSNDCSSILDSCYVLDGT